MKLVERLGYMWKLITVLLTVMILLASGWSTVFGTDMLDWGVERIRSYCVWDNDNWNMSNWNTTGSWDIDPGANAGQNVAVAIIDSGMDYTVNASGYFVHPDLAANVKAMAGFYYDLTTHDTYTYTDPVSNASDIKDDTGHGTQIAGIIAATINTMGLIGAAPNVSIISLRINSSLQVYAAEEAATAINYAVDLGVKVISISIGWSTNYSVLYNACSYAFSQGVLLVAAAGNEDTTVLGYPASYSFVISVGATGKDDNRASWSNYGPQIWFVAPGVDINTTTMNGGYTTPLVNGTSFSTPLVSATAALVFNSKMDPSYGPPGSPWDAGQVLAKLVLNGTLDLLPPGKDNDTGYGLINAWLANQRPIGNINGDTKTDGKDIALASLCFGSAPGSPNWQARADVNIDKKADGKDIAIIALHFGQVDP
jgi:hypothetical protein